MYPGDRNPPSVQQGCTDPVPRTDDVVQVGVTTRDGERARVIPSSSGRVRMVPRSGGRALPVYLLYSPPLCSSGTGYRAAGR